MPHERWTEANLKQVVDTDHLVSEGPAFALLHVELGLLCADICRALDRGMNGKKMDDLNLKSV